MNIQFTPHAWEEFTWWLETDKRMAKKIQTLIKDIQRTPFDGLGQPEPLKHDLAGFWSRRISGEHRLVYAIDGQTKSTQICTIVQCRFHYD